MQLICTLPVDAEQYILGNYQTLLRPPSRCPHCRKAGTLLALGYYTRYLSSLVSSRVSDIRVRRFRCRLCGRTVSLLPWFAQPYRLIQNETIHRFAVQEIWRTDVQHWIALLVRYWHRFELWLPELRKLTRGLIGRAPPLRRSDIWWKRLVQLWGDFDTAASVLVGKFQTTFFGRYRCHRPNPPIE